ARRTGVESASGEWIMFLDSDDELLPGALSRIREEIDRHGNVERVAFMYRRDDGWLSPQPPLRDEVLDYPSYVASLEGRRLYDFICCTRRFTFDTVNWDQRRWGDHCLYHLDFAQSFRTFFCSDAVAQVHTDAPGRLSKKRRTGRF